MLRWSPNFTSLKYSSNAQTKTKGLLGSHQSKPGPFRKFVVRRPNKFERHLKVDHKLVSMVQLFSSKLRDIEEDTPKIFSPNGAPFPDLENRISLNLTCFFPKKFEVHRTRSKTCAIGPKFFQQAHGPTWGSSPKFQPNRSSLP